VEGKLVDRQPGELLCEDEENEMELDTQGAIEKFEARQACE